MINVEELDKELAETIGMDISEFKAMLDSSKDNHQRISGPADIKVAISNAMRANRVLSKITSILEAKLTSSESMFNSIVNSTKERIYKYKRERNAGLLPLGDKEFIEEDYQEKLKEYNLQLSSIENIQEEDKRTAALKELGKAPKAPRYTSINITEYTNAEVEKTTETAIKEISKAYANSKKLQETAKSQVALKAANILLEGVRKEMSSLGNLAGVISSEQYGMNRQTKVDSSSIKEW